MTTFRIRCSESTYSFMGTTIEDLIHEGAVGIVAGSGDYPTMVARRATDKGIKVYACLHKGESNENLEEYCQSYKYVKVGQLGKIISFFKSHKVKYITFCGGINRGKLHRGHFFPDLIGLKILSKALSFRDDEILRAVIGEMEDRGFCVFGGDLLFSDGVIPVGLLTKRACTQEELFNIKLGWDVAAVLGAVDVGQCVVVSEKTVIAVEAIEGTDEVVRRAGKLVKGKGFVVVKRCKPCQDVRIDLPAIGTGTIENIAQNGGTAIALEAGKTVVINVGDVVRLADQKGIAIIALDDKEIKRLTVHKNVS